MIIHFLRQNVAANTTRIVHTARSAAGRRPRALAAGGEQGLAQRLLRLRRPGEADQLAPAGRPIRRVTTRQQDSHLLGAKAGAGRAACPARRGGAGGTSPWRRAARGAPAPAQWVAYRASVNTTTLNPMVDRVLSWGRVGRRAVRRWPWSRRPRAALRHALVVVKLEAQEAVHSSNAPTAAGSLRSQSQWRKCLQNQGGQSA